MNRDLREMADYLLVQHVLRHELERGGGHDAWAPYRRLLVSVQIVLYDLSQSLQGNPGLFRLLLVLFRSGYGIFGAAIRLLLKLSRAVARAKAGFKYQRLLLR